MQLLARMCGWQAPERHELEHDFKDQKELVDVIAVARERSSTQQSVCGIGLAANEGRMLANESCHLEG
jgi:hypothetical protein